MENIMDMYARAAATLYGIISFNDFFRILDYYYGEGSLSKESIMRYFWTLRDKDPVYYIQDELIVHAVIPSKDVAQVLFEIWHPLGAKAPQYYRILPEKEFLMYADPRYYEETAGTRRMEDYLTSDLGLSLEDAREIVAEMVFVCRSGACPTYIMDALNRRGILIRKNCNLDLITMGCEMESETRQWERLRATGKEMAGR